MAGLWQEKPASHKSSIPQCNPTDTPPLSLACSRFRSRFLFTTLHILLSNLLIYSSRCASNNSGGGVAARRVKGRRAVDGRTSDDRRAPSKKLREYNKNLAQSLLSRLIRIEYTWFSCFEQIHSKNHRKIYLFYWQTDKICIYFELLLNALGKLFPRNFFPNLYLLEI